jgi:hypothetical protein
MAIEGFWSYVHADDAAETGRIADLARDMVSQYELLTGESISLFLDRDNLEWGDEWRIKVDDSLASIAFFIPILTPRYFLSAECRRELNSFIRKSQALGLTELLMPILYIDFPAIHAEPADDELIGLVRPFQWEDWTELRFEERESSEYRRAVARLAQRLVNANAASESVSAVALPPVADGGSGAGDGEEEEPGSLEVLQGAIDGMAQWSETLNELGENITRVGDIMAAGTAQIDKATPKTEIAVRLRALKSVAMELEQPVDEIDRLSQAFSQNLYDVDSGVRYAIEQAPIEVATGAMELLDACEFFQTIRDFAGSAEAGLGSTQDMVNSIAPIEKLSRDIRPVLRTLRKALTLMVEGRDVIRSWVTLIDDTGLECGPPDLK